MSLYNFSMNETDLTQIVINTSQASPVFMNGLIFFIWMTVTLIGYSVEKSKTGRGNIFQWLTLAGFFCVLFSFILFVINGIISLETLSIEVILFMIFALIFMFTEN
jgi:hypothetical protein